MFDVVLMHFSGIQSLYCLARVLIKWKRKKRFKINRNRDPVYILSHLATEC